MALPFATSLVAPAVQLGPIWLANSTPVPPPAKWRLRKLLFFAGHIPKLFLSRVRYEIWRQVRQVDDVTTFSSTLSCTVGAWQICQSKAKLHDGHSFQTFCYPKCARLNQDGSAKEQTSCVKSEAFLQRTCASYYLNVNFTAELPDMERDTRTLAKPEYFRLALDHRFCLAAPGDFMSTPKITEFVAVAAAGGCLPVIVLPDSTVDGDFNFRLGGDHKKYSRAYARWSALKVCSPAPLSARR